MGIYTNPADMLKASSEQKLSGTQLRNLGISQGPAIGIALALCREHLSGLSLPEQLEKVHLVIKDPNLFLGDDTWRPLAEALMPKPNLPGRDFQLQDTCVPFEVFGEKLVDAMALAQMETAARLPISVRGALMPDAHPGYGLPIGGVLATRNAVIPYGVGVDIGCRMCLTVFDIPIDELMYHTQYFLDILKNNTVFGGARNYTAAEDHEVLYDRAFGEIPFLKALQPNARKQLGTSGGGNHFVEFGIVEYQVPSTGTSIPALSPGRFVGLLSHSGSRGLGASIASYYTQLAKISCRLPPGAKHLAWLDLSHTLGLEYWTAMTLAGNYASACHQIIHQRITRALRANPVHQIENHHNFAWKETYQDQELIVHRKGATPAAKGQLAIIPGSMTDPGFIVQGKGNPASLNSASHGAGRMMSRSQALERLTYQDMKQLLQDKGVLLSGGGLDESPLAYKSINSVMHAQESLVDIVGLFYPKAVVME